MKKFVFYLPKLNKYRTIKARDESTAVWKLLNQFILRESDIDGFKIVSEEKSRFFDIYKKII